MSGAVAEMETMVTVMAAKDNGSNLLFTRSYRRWAVEDEPHPIGPYRSRARRQRLESPPGQASCPPVRRGAAP
ncbi:hypothetical protein GCM10017557_40250 [Streptomyces aurantiacus]|uniref:Uncharacterized protein n=1 Tax=Streptomyces aurantiacus TaxID=47760 RepID=A0A7G1P5V0_9ACTN|nr:hypothetical protein GCM10017557_40250 [Streptomyces aurantiacus]